MDPSVFRANHKLQPAELDELVWAYEAGVSPRKLSRQFGAHEQTIRRQRLKRGVTLRPVVKEPAPLSWLN